MRYVYDHDLHIHSQLSLCSNDPGQTTARILSYAEENGLHTVCVTDHFWDETTEGASNWYAQQNYAHIEKALPLPQKEGIKFLFGCETEMIASRKIGVTPARFGLFDFIIVPTTHFHMRSYTLKTEEMVSTYARARAWEDRFDALLNSDLPFGKVGVAHLTCGLLAPTREECLESFSLISEDAMKTLFTKAAAKGLGIELNGSDLGYKEDEEEIILRPYRIAKASGCRFYCGSDAHHPAEFGHMKERFERVIDALSLTEEDHKFRISL